MRVQEQSLSVPIVSECKKVQTNLITAVKVWVSPPPTSAQTTQTALTDWKISFVGPCHLPKILGKKVKAASKVTLYEPLKIIVVILFPFSV